MLREKDSSGERWMIQKIKFDGYRIQAQLQAERPAIYTPGGARRDAALPADRRCARGLADEGSCHR
jgi:hypothetical protein